MGSGSSAQVGGYIFVMIASTSSCEATERQQRGLVGPGSGSVRIVEGDKGLERKERIDTI